MIKSLRYWFAVTAALLLSCAANAQPGIVHKIAGGGTSFLEGVPATSANLANPVCLFVDAPGNIYVHCENTNRIRKIVAATGLIYTVAGDGVAGFSGDGGLATNARIGSDIQGICVDASGNLYISDKANRRVRKVDAATGIISTLAGCGIATAALGDGGPAVLANVDPTGIAIDGGGSLYIGDNYNSGVRKVNLSSGVITTVAGGATATGGDGGPAVGAFIGNVIDVTIDVAGDLYISQSPNSIRKVDAVTGVITTACSSLLSIDSKVEVDLAKNIYMRMFYGGHIVMKDAVTLAVNTLDSGPGSYATLPDGCNIADVHAFANDICVDMAGNIYFTFGKIYKINSVSYMMASYADSFQVYTEKLCSGAVISIGVPSYSPGKKVITYFGDGTTDTSMILSVSVGGFCSINHTYNAPGSYTVKHVLYNGISRVDSLSYPYDYAFCRTLPVKIYNDKNWDCVKDDVTERYTNMPLDIVVDSNGVTIDTLSATSGFYYNAYGNPNDIYSFKLVNVTPDVFITCPSTGAIIDTILSSVTAYADKYFGLSCSMFPYYDFGIHATLIAGPQMVRGHVVIQNSSCDTETAIITVTLSPKYIYNFGPPSFVSPTPAYVSGNTMSWSFNGLSGVAGKGGVIAFRGVKPAGVPNYLPGDTVQTTYTINPIAGDANPADNMVIGVDTVISGYDPNSMEVIPNGCIGNHKTMEYTIHFENTGNDTAHNIYVLDTLSDDVDPSTIKIVASSATMFISWNKVGGRTIVKFDFPEINLLDSSHHGECDGMVVFTVNIRSGLQDNTHFYNQAGIYFDTNPVVMTNTVENLTSCWPVAVPIIANTKAKATLYPNPSSGELTIKMGATRFTSCTISNSIGQTMLQQDINGTQAKLDINKLPTGVYYITLTTGQDREVQKFVKW